MPPHVTIFRNLFLEDSNLQRILQCPAWRVKAWLLLGGQEIRQGLWTQKPPPPGSVFSMMSLSPGMPVTRE